MNIKNYNYRRNEKSKFLTNIIVNKIIKNVTTMKTLDSIYNMRPVAVEKIFNENKFDSIPLIYDISSNKKITLIGRIDRYDIINNKYINIIDYKSSNNDIDLTKMLNGLKMQLLIYWKLLSNINNDNIISASFLGLNIDPIKIEELENNNEIITSFYDLKKKIVKLQEEKYKYNGIVLENEILKDDMPNYLSLYNKKSLKSNNEENEVYLTYTEYIIKNIANKIYNGHFPILPYKINEKNGIQYSEYKEILQFDELMGDKFNELEKVTNKQNLIKKMNEILNKEKKN